MTLSPRDCRDSSERAFEHWVPRRCTTAWLELVSGPAPYRWDLEAVQRGLVDPLYAVYASRPERSRPSLTALVLAAGGVDPARHSSLLAAVELWYLASGIRGLSSNARSVAEATPAGLGLPLPVLSTVAFTINRFAMDLVTSHSPALAVEARTALVGRVAAALSRALMARAIDNHRAEDAGGARDDGDGAYLAHVRAFAGALAFEVPLECAFAVVPADQAAREAAAELGVAWQLASEVAMALEPRARSGCALPLEVALAWRPVGHRHALALARQAAGRGEAHVERVRPGLRPALEQLATACDERLRRAEEILHGQ